MEKKEEFNYDFLDEKIRNIRMEQLGIKPGQDVANNEPKKKSKKKPKSKKGIIIALIATIVLLVSGVVVVCVQKEKNIVQEKTLDFNESCFSVEMFGYDSGGWCVVDMDQYIVEQIFIDKVKPKYEYTFTQEIKDKINIKVDNSEELSNGDEVTVTINVADEILKKYDIVLGKNKFKVAVSDLPEKIEFDPFENLNLFVSEVDGKLKINILNVSNGVTSGYDPTFAYQYNVSDNMRMGDELTIFLNSELETWLLMRGYVATATSKTYVLEENTLTFVSVPEQISDEFILNIESDAEAKLYEIYEEYEIVELKAMECDGIWLATGREEYEQNELALLYKLNLSYKQDKNERTVYMLLECSDIFLDSYGKNGVTGVYLSTDRSLHNLDANTMVSVPGVNNLEDIMEKLVDFTLVK